MRHCKPEPFFESLDPLLGNHCIFSNLFILLFFLILTACFSDIFKNGVKGPLFNKEQQKRQNGFTDRSKLMTFRQRIRERNHDIVSVWGMVFSL